jgi:hypothetical protein
MDCQVIRVPARRITPALRSLPTNLFYGKITGVSEMHWLGFLASVVVAGVFYWLRNQHRLAYGTIEIFVGLAMLLVAFNIIATPIYLTKDGTASSEWLLTMIGVVTGVYALVRGWDDIITELRS